MKKIFILILLFINCVTPGSKELLIRSQQLSNDKMMVLNTKLHNFSYDEIAFIIIKVIKADGRIKVFEIINERISRAGGDAVDDNREVRFIDNKRWTEDEINLITDAIKEEAKSIGGDAIMYFKEIDETQFFSGFIIKFTKR
jgi:hypothetical protein